MVNPFHRGASFDAWAAPAAARPALWRVLATLALVGAGLLAAGFGAGLWLLRAAPGADPLAALATREGVLIALGSFAPWWLALSLALPLFHRRSVKTLFGPGPGMRLFALGAGAALGVGALGVALGAALTGAPVFQGLAIGDWALYAALAAPLILIQTGAEEILFRGYLMQQLAVRFRSAFIWAGLPSVLFGLLHFNPLAPGGALPVVIVTGTVGLVLAAVTARTGGLAAAWGVHFGVNTLALLFVASPGYLSGLALFHWRGEGGAFLIWLDLALILAAALAAWIWVSRSPRGG